MVSDEAIRAGILAEVNQGKDPRDQYTKILDSQTLTSLCNNDSLSGVEIILRVEERNGIEPTPDNYCAVPETVGELVRYVQDSLQDKVVAHS